MMPFQGPDPPWHQHHPPWFPHNPTMVPYDPRGNGMPQQARMPRPYAPQAFPRGTINDKATFLEALAVGDQAIRYANDELRSDREVVLKAIKVDSEALRFASGNFRDDREVVLEAVKHYGAALEYATEDLRADREVVFEAVKRFGQALQYASEELRSDPELVLEAFREDVVSFAFASEQIRADKDFVLQIIGKQGVLLQHASEELRSDPEVVLAAIQQDPWALECASPELRADPDMVLLVARDGLKNRRVVRSLMEQAGIADDEFFRGTTSSSIAVQGEQEPILSVGLTKPLDPSDGSRYFRCEVFLLSGANFVSTLPGSVEGFGPTLDDLAVRLLQDLPRHTEVKQAKRVFISFTADDQDEQDGSDTPASPWDWNRCLEEFLPRSAQG